MKPPIVRSRKIPGPECWNCKSYDKHWKSCNASKLCLKQYRYMPNNPLIAYDTLKEILNEST